MCNHVKAISGQQLHYLCDGTAEEILPKSCDTLLLIYSRGVSNLLTHGLWGRLDYSSSRDCIAGMPRRAGSSHRIGLLLLGPVLCFFALRF